MAPSPPRVDGPSYDYIVVGSGAGGGPVAAALARAGFEVLLLEAGSDRGSQLVYQVPVFHGLSTEDEAMRWDYFVRHYEDPARQQADSKYSTAHGGVLYPRAGTLGGCTAHNAMITVYPHNSDWDAIAEATGDKSWRAREMRRYFERLERCDYLLEPGKYPKNFWRRLALFILRGFGMASRANPSRHGFGGWLHTNLADPLLVIHDSELVGIIEAAAKAAGALAVFGAKGILNKLRLLWQSIWRGQDAYERAKSLVDPNDWRNVARSTEGIALIPLATQNGQRNGTREHILAVQQAGHKLTVELEALATRVLLDDGNIAIGVEYLKGRSLYRADPRSAAAGAPAGEKKVAYARREVILSAGSFNTPQLLMLSGIGPLDELQKHGISARVPLPGVGRNLQDRYEVAVISDLKKDFQILADATFDPVKGDKLLDEWKASKRGLYTSNGAILGIVMRSKPERKEPDLFVFGLPGFFKGYFPGYSKAFFTDEQPKTAAAEKGEHLEETKKCRFTWAILKAHTNNTAGFVRLRSSDPRDTPEINFKYFDEGNDAAKQDLESVVEGVNFVRRMSEHTQMFTKSELLPGKDLSNPDALRTFIKDEAWGHHACGTCKMGPASDPMAVVDSAFRVHKTHRLRVVDASIFPRIPGFFIVTPIYMISEKAADVILADAKAMAPGDTAATTARTTRARAPRNKSFTLLQQEFRSWNTVARICPLAARAAPAHTKPRYVRRENPTRRTAIVAGGLGVGAASLAALHGRGGGPSGSPGASGETSQPKPATSRMPVVYLPHGGGPWPFVDLGFDPKEMAPLADYLRRVAAVPRQPPKALLVVSAHWEEDVPTLMTAARPPMLYDYYGFPPESYQITWPAPGDPTLAARVRQLLGAAGIASGEDAKRGFDHGTFVPLKLAYPDADVPAVQLSLKRGLDPEQHLAIGRAIAPLRDEGVFIVGSGMSFHNLRAFGDPRARPISEEFDAWLRESAVLPQGPRDGRLVDWALAPQARLCHPREEHLLPLMVIAGAAGADRGTVGYGSVAMGVRLSSYHFG